MGKELKIFGDKESLFNNAANDIIELINLFIKDNNKCTLVLSGGSTPGKLYKIISRKHYNKVNWDRVFIFWGDERCVPPDNDESNYRSAKIQLLDNIQVPGENVFRIPAELAPIEAAEEYETTLRKFFSGGALPSFDIMLLGIGNDGHTASLFPNCRAVEERDKWVTYDYVERIDSWRVTLTLPVINNSKNILFLVTGKEKSAIVNKIMKETSAKLPAQAVYPVKGKLVWYLDKAAASELKRQL